MSGTNDDSLPPLDYLDPRRLRALLAVKDAVFVVDVRSPEEFAKGHIVGAVNIPAPDIARRSADLPKNRMIATVCNLGGSRSTEAAAMLRSLGFDMATPLQGGMRGWSESEK